MEESELRPRLTPLQRFLEAFFHERNIQWMLATGVLILLGSSLMLVTSHWREITPAWKCIVLLGYTACAYVAGHVARFHLALPRTGTVLLALTVLLIPIDFLALHLFGVPSSAIPAEGMQAEGVPAALARLPLLAATAVFSFWAARRIFHHFLRGPQPTFLASYLTLSAAGALVPALNPSWAPWTSLALWLVFVAGALKANRRVFWLMEEQRHPRIFAFFPLILLGGQFLAVFLLHLYGSVEVRWIGLGCVLTAVPVFLTTDSVARVFEARTGGLVRPFPASVILPLALGLVFCAGGMSLAAADLFIPGRNALALAPSAALTAFLMARFAARTRKGAFAWAAIGAATLAYNFTPALCRDLAARVVSSSAQALDEPKLPWAFYGLTYLPLLSAMAFLGAHWRDTQREIFARPMRLLAAGLASLLLCLAPTHPKALFPVSAGLAMFFWADTFLLRDRRLLAPACIALLACALGFETFAERVLGLDLPAGTTWLAVSVVAAGLLTIGRLADRVATRWDSAAEGGAAVSGLGLGMCAGASALSASAALLLWFLQAALEPPPLAASAGALALAAVLGAHAVRWGIPSLGAAAVIAGNLTVIASCAWRQWSAGDLVSLAAALALGESLIAAASRPTSTSPAGQRFLENMGKPAALVVEWMLVPTLAVAYPLLFAAETLGMTAGPAGSLFGIIASLLSVGWAFAAARRSGSSLFTFLGVAGALGLASGFAVTRLHLADLGWLPLIASVLALLALPGRHRLPGLASALTAVFCAAAAASFFEFTWPLRLGGIAALLGIAAVALLDRRANLRCVVPLLATWQVLAVVLQILSPDTRSLADLFDGSPRPAALPLAAIASLATLASRRLAVDSPPSLKPFVSFHCAGLRFAASACLALPLVTSSDGILSAWNASLAAAAFLFLAAGEIRRACDLGDPRRAWIGEAVIGAGTAYLAWFGVIRFGHGASLFVLAAAAFGFHGLARLAARSPRSAVLVGPFRKTAFSLPLAAAAVAVAKHIAGSPVAWVGANSLALLLGAAFLFWRAIEEEKRGAFVLAAVVVNTALALAWRELGWQDPQLYLVPVGASILALVELLRAEIPKEWRDPLRYTGALVILVSPIVHIVEGSWAHLLSLMVLSSLVILASIGLRIRATMYAGLAFLGADLTAMVLRGSIQNRNLLWTVGVILGGLIVSLAALCENHREAVLQKLRAAAARIEEWR